VPDPRLPFQPTSSSTQSLMPTGDGPDKRYGISVEKDLRKPAQVISTPFSRSDRPSAKRKRTFSLSECPTNTLSLVISACCRRTEALRAHCRPRNSRQIYSRDKAIGIRLDHAAMRSSPHKKIITTFAMNPCRPAPVFRRRPQRIPWHPVGHVIIVKAASLAGENRKTSYFRLLHARWISRTRATEWINTRSGKSKNAPT